MAAPRNTKHLADNVLRRLVALLRRPGGEELGAEVFENEKLRSQTGTVLMLPTQTLLVVPLIPAVLPALVLALRRQPTHLQATSGSKQSDILSLSARVNVSTLETCLAIGTSTCMKTSSALVATPTSQQKGDCQRSSRRRRVVNVFRRREMALNCLYCDEEAGVACCDACERKLRADDYRSIGAAILEGVLIRMIKAADVKAKES